MSRSGIIFRNIFIVLIMLCNVGCDQISKIIVRTSIEPYTQIKFFNERFTLTNIENSGAFLSMGNTWPLGIRIVLFMIFPLIYLCLGIWYLLSRTKISNFLIAGGAFMIGGGLGNLFDRIVYGSVTDFLHLDFGLFETGVFNLADVSIMLGIAIILVEIITNNTTILGRRTAAS